MIPVSHTATVELIIKGITLASMLIGVLVLPILPGLIIIWIAALGYGLVSGFGTTGWITFAIMTVLMAFGSLVDNVLMSTQAHKEGAPWWVTLVALAAGILGSIFIPLPIIGGILAALVSLFGVEWLRCKDWRKALNSLKGMMIGCGWAWIIRLVMAVVMIGLWAVWVFMTPS
jgi:uncharacterized protein YqgC (DUF456 family)